MANLPTLKEAEEYRDEIIAFSDKHGRTPEREELIIRLNGAITILKEVEPLLKERDKFLRVLKENGHIGSKTIVNCQCPICKFFRKLEVSQ